MRTRVLVFNLLFFIIFGDALVFGGVSYYVDFSAAVNGIGSLQSPWNNLGSVKSKSFSTGDDVYFKCGTLSNRKESLTVDWSGTSADKVIIGSYYINNGSAVHGVSGSRPIFDLQKDYPCAGDIRLDSCFYNPIIRVARPHVAVKNIVIKNSSGGGILFSGPNQNYPNNQASYGEMHNVLIQTTTGTNLGVENMDHFNMTDSELADAPTTTGRPWPGNFYIKRSNDVLIDGCIVRNAHKEGVNIAGSQRVEIRNSIYYALNRLAFNLPGHVGGEILDDINIHHNIICGSAEYGGALLYLGDEPVEAGGGSNIRLHNNLVGAMGKGGVPESFINLLSFGNCVDASGQKVAALWKDVYIYNNTFVETRDAFYSRADPAYTRFENCQIKNNIFVNYYYNATDFLYDSSKLSAGIDFDYNLWGHKPHSYLQGARDPGYPDYANQIIGITKTSGWEDLSYQGITKDDFKINDNSMAINNGLALDIIYSMDNYGTARPQGVYWDMGAHEYVGQSGSVPPAAPGGLSVK